MGQQLGQSKSSDDNGKQSTTSTKSPSTSQRTPMKSQKLSRTLKELESAFTDWEGLSSNATAEPAPVATAVEASRTKNEQSEIEFRKKTKKLLNQLREQLAELND